MWDMRRRGHSVVDITAVALTIEPRHDYSHAISTRGNRRLSGVEYEANRKLFRGCRYYTTANATHVLNADGLAPASWTQLPISWRVRISYWVYFLLKGRTYPYSLPLILSARVTMSVSKRVRSLIGKRRRASLRSA